MNALTVVREFEAIPQGYCAEMAASSFRARRAAWTANAPDPRMVELRRLADIDNAKWDCDVNWRRAKAALAVQRAAAALAMARSFPNRQPSIRKIQAIVAGSFLVPSGSMMTPCRKSIYVFPRMVAMYLARRVTDKSLPEIGRRFGRRDHTTVLHSVRTIAAQLAACPEFAIKVGVLQFEIEGRDD